MNNHLKFIIILVFFGASIYSKLYAQDIETMLNYYGYVFQNKEEAFYQEAEDYLMKIDKDSLESNVKIELLYHLDLAYLYSLVYNDWEKSSKEQGILFSKLEPYRNLPEYSDLYKSLIIGYGYHLMNSGQFDKAESILIKAIVENFFDEYDINYYNVFDQLSRIYENRSDSLLSAECHNKCQEFLVKRFVKDHPQYSFYLDNYRTLKMAINNLEYNERTNTESFINNICSLGSLLHKVDYGEYWEAYLTFQKALNYSIKFHLFNCSGLTECYTYLLNNYIEHMPEPMKDIMVNKLIPLMNEYYSGSNTPAEILFSVSIIYAINNQTNKAIEYSVKSLNMAIDKGDDKNTIMKIYQSVINNYLDLSTDSANITAFDYLTKFESIVSDKDDGYFDWYLHEKGILLRYLYKNIEAIKVFKNNLKYFKAKYGKASDQYVKTLNQLSMTYPVDNQNHFSYLQEAKELIAFSGNVKEETSRGVSLNLARYYISQKMFNEARKELSIVEDIENKLGMTTSITEDLINQCTQK